MGYLGLDRVWLIGAAVAGLCCCLPAAGAAPELKIVDFALRQYDGGPPVAKGFPFYPGDNVFLTFHVSGFKTAPNEDEEDRLRLNYTIDAYDPQGVPLKETVKGKIDTVLTRQDKKQKWLPLVRYDTPVPSSAPGGVFRIVVQVTDQIAGASTKAEIPFEVRGAAIAPSDVLVVRNFRFYRTETASKPMPEPVYHPGDQVWARFLITGYKFGEKNRLHVDYGIRVLGAGGKLLYEQPLAAEEDRASFYPERQTSGGLSLNLTKDLAPGEYTILLTVHDRIGGQTCQEKHVFRVE